jgi:GntR family transcriptional regulator / MocR family aminotransferase
VVLFEVHFAVMRQTTFHATPPPIRAAGGAKAGAKPGSKAGWAALCAVAVERDGATPIFRQVYLQMRGAILGRRLAPGAKLPSTRALAAELGIARSSVIAAYEQLLAEGYLSGRVGSGTYISADLPEPVERQRAGRKPSAGAAPTLSSQARAFAALAAFAVEDEDRPFTNARVLIDTRTIEVWRKLSQELFRGFDPIHRGYADARGLIALRRGICDYLGAARGVRAAAEQIIITSGTQHAIDIATRVLLSPGDEVWVEDPGYPMTRRALAAFGIALRPVAVDAQGLNVRAGLRAAPKARAAFITPSHQYPLGIMLAMNRRLELLAWARENGGWIVEDDYHSEYRYAGRPLAALQGLDEAERVIYVGTFNKVLFPGLRLGYIVVPPALVPSFAGARFLLDRQAPTLPQILVAEFMRQGYFAAHIRRMRLLYRDQRDLVVGELQRRLGARISVTAPEQGMHLVAYLGDGLSDVALEAALRERGVVVRALSRMYLKAPPRQGFLLGFTGFPRQVIAPALARLARVVAAAKRGSADIG